jgi:uncharacterized protein (DUF2141 family)
LHYQPICRDVSDSRALIDVKIELWRRCVFKKYVFFHPGAHMKAKILAPWLVINVIVGCSGAQMAEKAVAMRPEGEGSIEVSVEGVSSDKGIVYGSIYISTEGFPEDKELAYTYRFAAAAEASDGAILLQFPSVPAGWFVVAVLHDKDGNEELSFNPIGIPKEKYGFSRNPASLFGPPAFDDAAVFLEPGGAARLIVTIE